MMDKCEEFQKAVYQSNDLLCDAKKWKHIAQNTSNESLKRFAESAEEKLHEMYNKAHEIVKDMYED